MEFKDPYVNKPEKAHTPVGSQLLDTYIEEYDKNGKRYLKNTGKTNVYEKIQSYKEEVDTYKILDRFQKTGDQKLMNQRKGMYGDFTNMPTSQAEIQNKLIKAEKTFGEIDKEVRALFNNDINEFKTSIINNTFGEKMNKLMPKKVEETPQQPQIQNQGVNLNE